VLDWVIGKLPRLVFEVIGKLLDVIGKLPRLVFEVMLGDGDELLIRIIGFLIVVTLVTAGSDYDLLGSPLGPPLVAFGAPPCAHAGCLEWRPLTAARAHPCIALDENGPGHLLTRGMPSGNVKQLLRGLWLIMVELMHQGLAIHAKPECRDDVSVADFGELMALVGKLQNVISQGLALLLSATLQIPGVARPYIRDLKVTGQSLPKILPAINRVPGQVVEPGPGRVNQVDRVKLDDEEVIIHPPALHARR
jgi:hypothetical protein